MVDEERIETDIKQALVPGLENPNLIDLDLGEVPLRFRKDDRVFVPTLTTKIIAGCLTIEPGVEVLDLGCGIGPLGIFAAAKGARSVTCLDIMPTACSLARYNATLNGVSEKVQVFQSDLFEAINGRQFDIIVSDVSGIADEVARISSWYPESVPTGGHDGTVPVLRMLDAVTEHLEPGGKLYLPVASLSRLDAIVGKACAVFGGHLQLIVDRMIPFSRELYQHRDLLERLRQDGIVDFVVRKSRCLWNLKVFLGTKS